MEYDESESADMQYICAHLHILARAEVLCILNGENKMFVRLHHLVSAQHINILMTNPLVCLHIGREESALSTSSCVLLLVIPLRRILPQVSQLRFDQVSAPLHRGASLPFWQRFLTPQLALLFLSPTAWKTAQGCREGANCREPASNPEWYESIKHAQPQGLYVQASHVPVHQCT